MSDDVTMSESSEDSDQSGQSGYSPGPRQDQINDLLQHEIQELTRGLGAARRMVHLTLVLLVIFLAVVLIGGQRVLSGTDRPVAKAEPRTRSITPEPAEAPPSQEQSPPDPLAEATLTDDAVAVDPNAVAIDPPEDEIDVGQQLTALTARLERLEYRWHEFIECDQDCSDWELHELPNEPEADRGRDSDRVSERTWVRRVRFRNRFPTKPEAFCAITGVASVGNAPLNVSVVPEDLDDRGFDLVVTAYEKTRLAYLGVDCYAFAK